MKTKEIYMYALAALIVLSVLTIIGLLIFISMPESNKSILELILGALIASFQLVIGYFFGSSKGSADKTELLAKAEPIKDNQ